MFVSIWFLLFFVMAVIFFGIFPPKYRSLILLLFSYCFCAWIDIRALFVLIIATLGIWLTGILSSNGRRKLPLLAIIFAVLLLCIYKYAYTFIQNTRFSTSTPDSFLTQLIMPLGFSFYIFQGIGYLTDIYQNKYLPEKNFLHFALSFAFFAKFVSGPIEKENSILFQIKELENVKLWDRGRLSTAFTYMLWGYFMKMVVADRLAISVRVLFGQPEHFDSLVLLFGAIFYAIQIYCDFAGYTYIAIGCAKVFGIDLTQNFEFPYCAKNITDFWRRWHISLSSWLRDYVYIPLGGNRKGLFCKCLYTMLVFILCGIWHGSGPNFIIWGLLHGIYSITHTLLHQKGIRLPAGRLITFLEVAFAWIFFRADTLGDSFSYIRQMLTAGAWFVRPKELLNSLELNEIELVTSFIGILIVWLADELCNKKQVHLPVLIQHRGNAVRYLFFYVLIILLFIFGIYGPGYHPEQFIYMKF